MAYLKPPRREIEDYSGWAPTSTKDWQLKPRGERKKITAVENQPARKVGSWNRRGERKKTAAVENQPARKVGSWNPGGERLQRMRINQHERLAVETAEEREHSIILCELFWYVQHVNYSATRWKFGTNCFSITEVLYSAVHLMRHVQSDVMWHYIFSWYDERLQTERYNTFRIVILCVDY